MEKCSFFALRLVDGMGAFAKVAPPPLPTEEMFPALDEGAGGDGSPHPRWKEGGRRRCIRRQKISRVVS